MPFCLLAGLTEEKAWWAISASFWTFTGSCAVFLLLRIAEALERANLETRYLLGENCRHIRRVADAVEGAAKARRERQAERR